MATEQDRITALEQQLERILTHLGTPDGQLFATEQRVRALEVRLTQQQIKLQEFEQWLKTHQETLAQQFQTATKGKSPEFTMLTKFVASQTTELLQKLQKSNTNLLTDFFQTTTAYPPQNPPLPPPQKQQIFFTEPLPQQIRALSVRLAMLETQSKEASPILQTNLSPILPDNLQEQLDHVQSHIRHLEDQVISHINHLYTTPNKQQPIGAMVKTLQSDVDLVKQEIKTIRTTQHKEVSQQQIYNVLVAQIQNHTNALKELLEKEIAEGLAPCAKAEDIQQTIGALSRELQSTASRLKYEISGTSHRIREEVRVIQHQVDSLDVQKRLRELEDRILQETNSIRPRISRLESAHNRLPLLQDGEQQPQQQQTRPLSEIDLRYNGLTKCFYTALFTDGVHARDTLSTGEKLADWDYICFTNIPTLESTVWDIVYVEPTEKTPAVQAKRMKWDSIQTVLKDYDVVVWMDAYMIPSQRTAEKLKHVIVDMWNQETMILHRPHKDRDCVYDECEAVITHRRDTPDHVALVKQMLHTIKMPKHWGLFDSNLLIKFQKYPVVQKVCSLILQQLRTLSPRDQLAITPVYYAQEFLKFGTKEIVDLFLKSGVHERHAAF